jgi:O-antigen ligase
VLLLFVVLLQHRTVWVVTVAMVMVGFVLSTVTRKRGSLPAAMAVLSVSLVVLMYQLGAFGTIGNAIATSFEEVRRSNSTLEWRLAGWQQLLPRSTAEWLSGVPFGSGYDRVVGGSLVTVGPHNYYVHLLLRLGLLSLVLLIGWYVLTWRRLSSKGPWDVTLRVLMAGQLIFFVTYSASPEQGVLLGLCMWYLRTRAAGAASGSGSHGVPPIQLPKSAGRPADDVLAAPTVRGASR